MKEYVDFLSAHEPYSGLDSDDLSRLAAEVEVEFFAAGTEIVRADGPRLQNVYIVRTGAVEVVDRGHAVDVLGPGDTFGHISVFSGLRPAFAVRCVEDTLCYRVPDPRGIVDHPECLEFRHYGKVIARDRLIASGGSFTRLERPLRQVMHPITWCDADMPVREVAALMSRDGASCAVYVLDGSPGIVTDTDFRDKVATGNVGIDAPVHSVASYPAFMVGDDLMLDTAYIAMIDRGIHHLLASDHAGRPVGVVRVMDIADTDVRNPLLVRSAAESAQTMDELVVAAEQLTPTLLELFESGLPPSHLGALHTAMLESVLRRIIELNTAGTVFESIACSWMLLGSAGRRETLPNSDLDTALAWDDDPDAAPADPAVVTGAAMTIMRAMRRCGISPCPRGLNAVNPEFNMRAGDWPTVIEQWCRPPYSADQLLHVSTMTDARSITVPTLSLPLRRELVWGAHRHELNAAMNAFATNTRPPAGFVREFVVERLGGRKGHLNLKKAGLRPIVSVARSLALRAGDVAGSTTERLECGYRAGYLNRDELDTLRSAFDLVYGLTIELQVHAIRDGNPPDNVVPLKDLGSMERRHLRDAFRSVSNIEDRLVHYPLWTG